MLGAIKDDFCLKEAQVITIGTTDSNKTLDTLVAVWEALQQGGATRHSLLINLGGGMVTDLGGLRHQHSSGALTSLIFLQRFLRWSMPVLVARQA